MRTCPRLIGVAIAAGLAAGAWPVHGSTAYHALGLTPQDVLTGTVLNARVTAGGAKQVICVATYFTGKRERADAVNVRFGVFDRVGGRLEPLYLRDFGKERGGFVGNGDLQLLDFDFDGVNEIVVAFDSFEDPLIEKRWGEILVYREGQFATVWQGLLEYDATRAARDVPRERQDRYTREIDLEATLRTRGATLFLSKKVIAVAGERLAEPRMIEETFPLIRPTRGG